MAGRDQPIADRVTAAAAHGVPGIVDVSDLTIDAEDVFDAALHATAATLSAAKEPYLSALDRFLEQEGDPDGRRAALAQQLGWSGSALIRPMTAYAGRATLIDPSAVLPGPEYETFDNYLRWLSGHGDDMSFQAPGIQVRSPRIALALRTCITGLIGSHTSSHAWATAFFGTSTATPMGVHVDPHHRHALGLVLHGDRLFTAWDAREVARLNNAAALLGWSPPGARPALDPIRLELTGGRAGYWPGSYAHVFANSGPFVGLTFVVGHPPRDTERELATQARALLATGARSHGPDSTPIDSLEAAEAVMSLRTMTMGANIPLDVPLPASVPHGDLRSRLDPAFPIKTRRGGERWFVGVNGMTVEVPSHSAAVISELVDHLNTASSTSLADLGRRFDRKGRNAIALESVLRLCVAAFGFVAENPDPARGGC